MGGKGCGRSPGSIATRFVARTTCRLCEVALTPENKHFGKCKDCYRRVQRETMARFIAANYTRVRAAARVRDRNRPNKADRNAVSLPILKQWAALNRTRALAAQALKERRRRARTIGTVRAVEWLAVVDSFNDACAYCLRTDQKLTMDHVIPLARGGPHSIDNLVPACRSCNSRKQARGPLVMVNRLANMEMSHGN